MDKSLTIKVKIDDVGLKEALQEAANRIAKQRHITQDEVDYRELLQTEINIRKFIKVVK